jgi:intraflagellar transport protein 140
LATDLGLNIVNFKGVVKQNFTFSESEGKMSGINLMNNSMVMWTANNYIRIFDLSRREYK